MDISNNISAAAHAFKDGIFAAGNKIGNGFLAAGNLVVDPAAQQKAEAAIRSGIDAAYTGVSNGFSKAVEVMERETSETGQIKGGVEVLRTQFSKLQNLTIKPLDISENDSTNVQSLKGLANKIRGYHQKVTRDVETAAVAAGSKAHGITRFLLTPIRLGAKALGVENLGATIQNSIALAVGFLVRGIVTVIGQLLGHIAPYVAAAAVIGTIGAGLAALAIKVSPIAAVVVFLGILLISQQSQILNLGKKVDDLTYAIRDDKRNETKIAEENRVHAEENTTRARAVRLASSVRDTLFKHKVKIGTGLLLAAFTYAGIRNREAIASGAKSAASFAANKASDLYGFLFPAAKVAEKNVTASEIINNFSGATGRKIADNADLGLEKLINSKGFTSAQAGEFLLKNSNAVKNTGYSLEAATTKANTFIQNLKNRFSA